MFSRCVTPGYITENGSSGIDFNQDDEQPAYVDFAYLARRFARCEPLRNAGALMLGLLSDLGRKNCWTLSERSGHATRIGCSICSGGRSGTPTKYATICGPMWSIILATTKRFWWSTRPAM